MGTRDIVIINGQSGMEIERCIDKIPTNSIISKIRLDPLMAEISGESFGRVLAEPPRLQERLWGEAFSNFINRLPAEEDNKFHILSFHACYYNQLKTELGCPVSFNRLLEIKDRVKNVITLIDDCYDIYLRLMDGHKMYASVLDKKNTTPNEAVFKSVINLIRIMTWRETEIAFSRKIAGLLGVPFYVIAVKHPRFILSRLIERPEEQLKILYLSHHISEIHARPSSSRQSPLPSDLSSFIQALLGHDNTVIFIPDTIDELEIDKEAGSFVPKLQRGWPLPYENEQLFEPLPAGVCNLNPLNPQEFAFDSVKALKLAISRILNILDSIMKEQVNSRDRTLVEQSKDGVVVYRPYYFPLMSSGVQTELMYNNLLKDELHEQNRKTFIVGTLEDLGKMSISNMFVNLKSKTSGSKDSGTSDRLDEIRKTLINDNETVLAVAENKHDKKKIKDTIEVSLGELKWNLITNRAIGKKGAMQVAPQLGEETILETALDSSISQLSTDPLHQFCDEASYFICKNSEFQNKVGSYVDRIALIE